MDGGDILDLFFEEAFTRFYVAEIITTPVGGEYILDSLIERRHL